MATRANETTVPLALERPRLPGYTFQRDLGVGGMGAVYLYRDDKLGRPAAVKVIHPKLIDDDLSRDRFLREARSLAKIDHENIVRIYSFVEVGGLSCFLMEYVEGRTLADWLKGPELLPIGFVIDVVRQTTHGLEAALSKGIIHRDIKPANLLIDPRRRLRIADLGLARPLARSAEEPDHTSGRMILGTPAYMSPEQSRAGSVDHRSDIYSLGVVFCEMLLGERSQPGRVAESLSAHVSGFSPELIALVSSMIAESPEDRPQSYPDVRRRLDSMKEAALVDAGAGLSPPRSRVVLSTPQLDSEDRSLARRLLGLVGSPDRWWEVDHLLGVFVLFPLWTGMGWVVDQWDPAGLGTVVFAGICLCQAVTTTLRLYLLLIAGAVGQERVSQVQRVTPWIRAVDILLMLVVLSGGLLLVRSGHTGFGLLMAGLAVAGTVKFLLLDPFLIQKANEVWGTATPPQGVTNHDEHRPGCP